MIVHVCVDLSSLAIQVMYLATDLSINLPARICLSSYLILYLSTYLLIYLPIYLSSCLSVCLSVYLSPIHLSPLPPPAFCTSKQTNIHPSLRPSSQPSIHSCIHACMHRHILQLHSFFTSICTGNPQNPCSLMYTALYRTVIANLNRQPLNQFPAATRLDNSGGRSIAGTGRSSFTSRRPGNSG